MLANQRPGMSASTNERPGCVVADQSELALLDLEAPAPGHALAHRGHRPPMEALIHDLEAVHLGPLVGGDRVEAEESEADVLDEERQAHRDRELDFYLKNLRNARVS